MNSSLNVNLRKKRLEYGKTQEEMAKLLNVKRATYGEYERGKISPPLEKVEMMASIFQMSIDSLIGVKMDSKMEHTVLISSEHLAERYKKWDDVIGDTRFTDEEIGEIIDYVRYIVWRKKDNNGSE